MSQNFFVPNFSEGTVMAGKLDSDLVALLQCVTLTERPYEHKHIRHSSVSPCVYECINKGTVGVENLGIPLMGTHCEAAFMQQLGHCRGLQTS